MMRTVTFRGAMVLVTLLATVTAGCEGHTAIPAGAQEVHATVVGKQVHLAPTTVRAGDVYLVIDTPGADVLLVQSQTSESGTPGGLSDADLARLAHHDTQFMRMTSGFANGEPHGIVSKLVLTAGNYAFLTDSPDALVVGQVIPPEDIAILSVTP